MEVPNCNEDCPVNDRFDDPIARPVNDLLPAYENPTPVGQNSVENPYVSAVESQTQPKSKPSLKSLFRFPKSNTTPTPSSARQAKGGFFWPSKDKIR
jgi:hypothetical protein